MPPPQCAAPFVQLREIPRDLVGLGPVGSWWMARPRGGRRELVRTLTALCLLWAPQGVVGITKYRLRLPTELVWVHVVLATLTWVAYVHAWLAPAVRRPAGAWSPTKTPDRANRAVRS